ncbi:hypothetical protein [Salana multivorans]
MNRSPPKWVATAPGERSASRTASSSRASFEAGLHLDARPSPGDSCQGDGVACGAGCVVVVRHRREPDDDVDPAAEQADEPRRDGGRVRAADDDGGGTARHPLLERGDDAMEGQATVDRLDIELTDSGGTVRTARGRGTRHRGGSA